MSSPSVVIHDSQLPKLRVYLRIAQVRARYGGASDEWVRRKSKEAGFPAPYYLHGADRYWLLEELDAWDAATLTAEPTDEAAQVATRTVTSCAPRSTNCAPRTHGCAMPSKPR